MGSVKAKTTGIWNVTQGHLITPTSLASAASKQALKQTQLRKLATDLQYGCVGQTGLCEGR